ncbi:thioesterase II family protein [Dolichospermum circinale]|uniref:thioesterase II family protein n=1 Tax=Dolichospermum circinale TaxID=109265 RepID=UPI00041F17D2|nr:thioesterase II family protein [Dolichospermum circinale]MDB9473115.1 thioesterase II family protein [Dolichospermum circinale CS-537/11]MDB9479162.1 thioesterase II family protein [Dolichospermum circinale CS-537/03]MDB9481772.1 thioesterase II family protein [Dolichospermum circinale CS-537/05]
MNTKTIFTSWITCPKPNLQAKLRLFCLPYAGGNRRVFHTWTDYLPKTIELCPIEIPGRGRQIKSPPYTEIQPLVREIATNIIPYLDKPYAFFGYSMGALISFELIRLLRSEYNFQPLHLFVAARHAPQLPLKKPLISQLSDADFLAEIYRLNGTPKEVLENAELMQLFMPIIRADFALIESYIYDPQPALDCPIDTFGGLQDREVSYNSLAAWQEQTTADFSLQMMDGDHFFINTAKTTLLKSVIQCLQSYI